MYTTFVFLALLSVAGVFGNQTKNETVKVSVESTCCSAIEITSPEGSVTQVNQWNRLGKFYLDGEEGGRPIYKQDNSQNYLYFLGGWIPGYNWWYVNGNLGENMGGLINMDAGAACPDEITVDWKAYAWTGEWEDISDWVADPDLKITCISDAETTTTSTTHAPPPVTTTSSDHESCTWGSWCDDCQITSVVNGVTYCCATDCNSGGISTNTNNGNVECYCYH